MKPGFSLLWNFLKGGTGILGGGAVGAIMGWVMRVWNGGDAALDPAEAAAFGAVLGWILLQGKNLLKQSKWNWTELIPVLVCVAMLQGCGTVSGLGGKLKYNLEFTDRVIPGQTDTNTGITTEGGQDTGFKVSVVAPPGTKIEELVSMDYVWNADQSGRIAVSKQANSDQTAQSAALRDVSIKGLETADKSLDTVNNALTLAAPIVGANLSGNQSNEAARIANKGVWRSQIIDIAKDPQARADFIQTIRELGLFPGADETGTN